MSVSMTSKKPNTTKDCEGLVQNSSQPISSDKAPGKADKKTSKEMPPTKAAWTPCCDMCRTPLETFDPTTKRMRCQDCHENILNWEGAKTWVDLIDFNRDFIEGNRKSAPYSVFPIFTDKALWPGLFMLHDYGIMVVDAQLEYQKVNFDEDHGKWFEIKERPYLRCVVPTNLESIPVLAVEAMLESLINNPLLEVVMFYEYADYGVGRWLPQVGYRCARTTTAHKLTLDKFPRHQYFRSSVGPSLTGRTLSKYRVADKKEDLMWQKWRRCQQNILPVVTERDIASRSQGLRAFGRETEVTASALPVIFMVAVRDWTEVGLDLFEIVRDACDDAGMEPLYQENEILEDWGEEEPDLAMANASVVGTGVVGSGTCGVFHSCELCQLEATHVEASTPTGQALFPEMPELEKLSVMEVD